MASRGIYVKGLEETIGKLRLLGDRAEEEIEKALISGGGIIAGYASINIVNHDLVDTGFMLDSVGVSEPYRKNYRTNVDIGTGAEYGIYHEFGTVNMPARAWLKPAMITGEEEAVQEVADALKAAVKAIV